MHASTILRASACSFLATLVIASENTQKPHLVFLLVDDLGWSDVSFRGGDGDAMITTPNFEALVSQGVLLNRHYTYSWCAPSRASLLSGRLPVHVNVNETDPLAFDPQRPSSSGSGIPSNMTIISAKLKQAGYATHYSGKWGVGFAWPEQMPLRRGFDSFLGYLHDSNDYWTSTLSSSSIVVPTGCEKAGIPGIVDLTKNDGPAYGLNGTGWEDYLFMNETLDRIQQHNISKPLFLMHAFHSIHTPLNPPDEILEPYRHIWDETRKAYAGMVSWVDRSVGEIVSALKAKGMWDNTLLVVSSDNGGPIYPGTSLELFGGASNMPLRGGKTSDWEGGIRVNAFASGGLIPLKTRGTMLDDYIHIADWYHTFCSLAGIDPDDDAAHKAGLPPIDSINQWPLLSGAVTPGNGHRTEMHISPVTLISGRWKLLMGSDPGNINKYAKPGMVPFNVYGVGYGLGALRQPFMAKNCSLGCLYDILEDPTEFHDLADQHKAVLLNMSTMLASMNQNVFAPDRGAVHLEACSKLQQEGYYGPIASAVSKH